ncbi:hypothetical protein AB833_07770 [Chromatiales bacterium (ex Bugula neritina AB1)]|nr:hypothetical protein AB833_07770 [Chromatiales bacterium (ex Bugula neritina AB1)]
MNDASDDGLFKIDLQAATKACAHARSALSENRLFDAINHALDAIAFRPSCFMAYQLLGQALDGQGRAVEATECYRGQLPERLIDVRFSRILHAQTAAVDFQRYPAFPVEKTNLPPAFVLEGLSGGVDREITSPGCFVDQVVQGTVWHDAHNTWVLDRSGREVLEHTQGCREVLQTLSSQHQPVWLGKRVIVLGARGAHNYYHWTMDIIPKMGVLAAAGFTLQKDDIYIVPFARNAFAIELLRRFAIRESQVVETEKVSPYITADEILVPWLQNKMGLTMGTWLPHFMRRSVEEAAGNSTEPDCQRRLYISRSDSSADGRTLGNQKELEACLTQRNFEIIYPENYTVAQQAVLFGSANVVLAAHGAGLANIVYCRPGTTVIELYGQHLSPCYQAICALAGYRYFNHKCDKTLNCNHDNRQAIRTLSERRSAGFSVCLNEVAKLLELSGAS